uniref:Uncharacterized protein n=1 Tax=Timema poppense TaxID=170557 RepID=A0A7R9CWY7_TIMPO|nr:unnamed protein product [Timema poppensis]
MNLHFSGGKVENHLGKPPSGHQTKIQTSDLPVLGSIAQHETSLSANYATKAGLIYGLSSLAKTILPFFVATRQRADSAQTTGLGAIKGTDRRLASHPVHSSALDNNSILTLLPASRLVHRGNSLNLPAWFITITRQTLHASRPCATNIAINPKSTPIKRKEANKLAKWALKELNIRYDEKMVEEKPVAALEVLMNNIHITTST